MLDKQLARPLQYISRPDGKSNSQRDGAERGAVGIGRPPPKPARDSQGVAQSAQSTGLGHRGSQVQFLPP